MITGSTARFAGEAEVNGVAGFRYEATAVDGRRADTFRLVVRSSSGALVYDSTAKKVRGEIAILP